MHYSHPRTRTRTPARASVALLVLLCGALLASAVPAAAAVSSIAGRAAGAPSTGWDCTRGNVSSLCMSAGLTPMPTPRAHLAVVAGADGRIYALGGNNGPANTGDLSTVEAYTPGTNTWSTLAPMRTSRAYLAAAAGADGRIYAIGGYDSGWLSSVEAYDPSTQSWSEVAPLPDGRTDLAAVGASDGRVYAIGGMTGAGAVVNSVDAYTPSTNAWTSVTPMPTARHYAAAALGSDGRIYVFGGVDSSGQPLRTVEAFAPGTATWTCSVGDGSCPPTAQTLAPLPLAVVGGAAAGTSDGQIYVLGSGTSSLQGAEMYSLGTNSWTTLPPLPTGRVELGAAAGSDGRIYAIGGDSGADSSTTRLSTVEAYMPTATAQPSASPSAPVATATVSPSSTPTVTSTPAPTRTPRPTATPSPSSTPTATAVPALHVSVVSVRSYDNGRPSTALYAGHQDSFVVQYRAGGLPSGSRVHVTFRLSSRGGWSEKTSGTLPARTSGTVGVRVRRALPVGQKTVSVWVSIGTHTAYGAAHFVVFDLHAFLLVPSKRVAEAWKIEVAREETDWQATHQKLVLHLDNRSFSQEGRQTGSYELMLLAWPSVDKKRIAEQSDLVSVYGSASQATRAFNAQLRGYSVVQGSHCRSCNFRVAAVDATHSGLGDCCRAIYLTAYTSGLAMVESFFVRGRVLIQTWVYFELSSSRKLMARILTSYDDFTQALDRVAWAEQRS